MFSYEKKINTIYLFLGVSTIFIVFMIFFILIKIKGVKKKISKRKKSEGKNTIQNC